MRRLRETKKNACNFGQRYRSLAEYFSEFLQKWRAMVEVRFLRCCVDPIAPQEPVHADAQQRQTAATAVARSPWTMRATTAASPALLPAGPLPTPLWPAREGRSNRFPASETNVQIFTMHTATHLWDGLSTQLAHFTAAALAGGSTAIDTSLPLW
jgi:hypothetical protein